MIEGLLQESRWCCFGEDGGWRVEEIMGEDEDEGISISRSKNRLNRIYNEYIHDLEMTFPWVLISLKQFEGSIGKYYDLGSLFKIRHLLRVGVISK